MQPLFETFANNDYAELMSARRQILSLQQHVEELEHINMDLEYRLEEETKQTVSIEHECMEVERKWRLKCEGLEEQVEEWEKKCEQLSKKSDRLREQISRTERELYGILQRKHELMRLGGAGGGASRLGGGLGGAYGQPSNGNLDRPGNADANAEAGGGINGRNKVPNALKHDRKDTEEDSLAGGMPSAGGTAAQQRRIITGLEDFLGL
mgnify:CR=1 FL=1